MISSFFKWKNASRYVVVGLMPDRFLSKNMLWNIIDFIYFLSDFQ